MMSSETKDQEKTESSSFAESAFFAISRLLATDKIPLGEEDPGRLISEKIKILYINNLRT